MSSRNRRDVVTLFDVYCEVGGSQNGVVILQKYPEDFNHEPTLKSIAQFTFPCGFYDDEEAVQLFSFVLTDERSQYTYAYCRYTPRSNTCLCILSGLPWANTFYAILNHFSAVMNNKSAEELESLLVHAYHTPIPGPGETLMIESSLGVNKLEVLVPDCSRLPTLRENKYLLEFYNALNEKQMIALYASLLKERRILFTGSRLGQLTSCVFAAAMLLYPMHWQSLFIPILPSDLIDMLMAPMPYLIGIPKKTFLSAKNLDLGEVVTVDLDQHTFQSPHNDMNELPSEVVQVLRNQFRSSADMFVSDGLARSFLRANTFLFGNYRAGFRFSPSCTWDSEKFVRNQRPCLQLFLKSLIGQDGVQYLERFFEERIAAFNAGEPINDEFEKEVQLMEKRPLRNSPLVRGNANEMIGALKDKVQSIALKERFSRLNSKDSKKEGSKPHSTFFDVAPMSFDPQQWAIENPEEEPHSSVLDLIDLSDDSAIPCSSLSTPFAPSRSLPMSPDLQSNRKMMENVFNEQRGSSVAYNAVSSFQPNRVSSQTSLEVLRQGWQRFD
ncbi:unnamed protein product [Enterobius vermicularis]|uniref:UDENN domain-containing protein n=1 Tax=Enterobius vermicularis TaxID=51028 RepID=A0A0N4UVI1_ENTVE|nr:unnamed protein product [Enterobius vermicularis]